MSRAIVLGAVALVGLLVMPTRGHARQVATEAELADRLETLRPQVDEARAAHLEVMQQREEQRRLAAAASARLDTLRLGLLTVVTPADQADAARELFTEVWERHFASVVTSPGVEAALFEFQWTGEPVQIYVEQNHQPVVLHSRERRSRVVERIRTAIAASVNFDLSASGSAVGDWTQGNPHDQISWGDVYREIATAPSYSVRACLDGGVAACASSLGIYEYDGRSIRDRRLNQDRLEEWYTPEERRALVAGYTYLRTSREVEVQWSACVRDERTFACDGLLRQFGRWVPLGGRVRASLVATALDEGGAGAWGRLLSDNTTTIEEALAHAAQMPFEELMEGWLGRVVTNRPAVYAQLGRNGALAFAWTFLFAALAVRSTRWRLG